MKLTLASVAAAALATAALAAAAPPASAYVTNAQAQSAADAAIAWFGTQQDATDGNIGFFGGDWAMIALAGGGKNAADLRTSLSSPSLQDYYDTTWQGFGRYANTTDYERGILTGQAGGIQTNRVSAGDNFVAGLASRYDGSQFGEKALLNDDIFGLLALPRTAAADSVSPTVSTLVRSRQQKSGGWNYSGGSSSPDTDVTGSAIAALCAAGATAGDPAVKQGLAFLKSTQNAANGGFDSTFFGSNSDSTAWAVDGLRQCGLDPQSAEWTTGEGKTPLDFLLSLANDDGSFAYVPGGDPADPNNANLYSTQAAVTALVGDGFGNTPPPRDNPSDPTYRPAPAVADGTTVPLTLVLDHGPAIRGAERLCSVDAPVGASVAEVLAAASRSTSPAYCVTGLQTSGSGAGERVSSLNGVAAETGATRWEVSVDGGPATTELTRTVALGSTVTVTLTGTPSRPTPAAPLPTLQPAAPASTPRAAAARVALATGKRRHLSRSNRVRASVRCPRGVGPAGCVGSLKVKYRTATAGKASFSVASGSRKLVSIKVSKRLAKLVRAHRRGRHVRFEAAVRDRSNNAILITRAGSTLLR